jgi:hypothetical protein
LSHHVKICGHPIIDTPIRNIIWVLSVTSVLFADDRDAGILLLLSSYVLNGQVDLQIANADFAPKQADHLTCSFAFLPMEKTGDIFIPSITIIISYAFDVYTMSVILPLSSYFGLISPVSSRLYMICLPGKCMRIKVAYPPRDDYNTSILLKHSQACISCVIFPFLLLWPLTLLQRWP